MTERPFHLQNSTTLDWTVNGTSYPVAGVTEATVSISSSIVELETGDSVKREDHYHHSIRFPVTVTTRKWDPTIITELAGSPDSGTAWEDRTDLPPFSLSGTFESAGGDLEVSIEVVDIPVPEDMPIFDLATEEYGEWTIESDGGDLATFDVLDNTSA